VDTSTDLVKRLVKEPLLHFLLLGAGLFLAYSLMQREVAGREAGQIVVTLGEVEQLATSFAKTWQRSPTPEELAGLVRDRVREEVYCREAMALGLDREDTIIRRRLRQKMEFVSEDIAALAEPTEADLEETLRTHPDSFRVEPRFTFRQVYFSPDKHGENLAAEVTQLLAQLNRPDNEVDASALGDSTLLEAQFAGVPTSEVAKQFGEPSRSSSAGSSPAAGRGRSSRATACTWCSSANARKNVSPRWRRCATTCGASGTTPGAWQPTRRSIRGCSRATT
jgi:hypothetical protein